MKAARVKYKKRNVMEKEKYVAYVSTYTYGNKSNFGIRIYNVDMENGRFTEKDQVEIISVFHYRFRGGILQNTGGWKSFGYQSCVD